MFKQIMKIKDSFLVLNILRNPLIIRKVGGPHLKQSSGSSHRVRYFLKIQKQPSGGVLKTLQNSQENTCARASFLVNLHALGLWHKCCLVYFATFLRTPFFVEHLASENRCSQHRKKMLKFIKSLREKLPRLY